ncbi:MAG: meso-butanediol dehydrogenase / (S,S)-butanediol dehydrogenase / diacetyl reductase [Actinomycetota bacterium]|jgi:NAD(P)-dependent dehydrogenase (short-subunit alcohol dehydrogenase family)
MARFDGRVVIVTGSASGIGQATAMRFGEDGATVVCADLNAEGAAATADKIGNGATSVALDVSDPVAAERVVNDTASSHGRIDVLANVAGILQFGHATDLGFEEWSRVIGVNLTGVFNMIRPALPHLIETKGNIVNVASTAGLSGQPYGAAYSASKGGVVLLTKSLAVEFAKAGVRVNAVCPGGVDTPLVANMTMPDDVSGFLVARMELVRGHFAPPSDIASVLCFLASDDARNMTGAAVPVDYGMTA